MPERPAGAAPTAPGAGAERVHVVTRGPAGAAPIVLVHGFGSSSAYFARLGAVLARRWSVLAVDLPGFGRSRAPRRPLTVAEHAEVLRTLLVQRGLDGAVLVGHSMGCQVVAGLLRAAPTVASRAVLIGPTVDERARSAVRQGLRLARNAALETKTLAPVQVRSYLACGPRTHLATLGAMLDDHLEEALAQVRAPVLLVRGQHDPIAPRRWVEQLRAVTPQAAVAQVRGAHHVAQWSHPQAVADLCSTGTGEHGGPR